MALKHFLPGSILNVCLSDGNGGDADGNEGVESDGDFWISSAKLVAVILGSSELVVVVGSIGNVVGVERCSIKEVVKFSGRSGVVVGRGGIVERMRGGEVVVWFSFFSSNNSSKRLAETTAKKTKHSFILGEKLSLELKIVNIKKLVEILLDN